MKRLILMLLAGAASLAAADYTGIWYGKGTIANPRYTGGIPMTVTMTLQQAGNSLQGTLQITNQAPIAIKSGAVSGAQLSFALVNKRGGQITAQLAANSNNQLAGHMTLTNGQIYNVTFSHTKQ
jgi:hypothetical protein